MLRFLGIVFACFASLSLAIDPSYNSSVFVYNNTDSGQQFVFALNFIQNDGLYFHMAVPTGNSWMAVGFGPSMDNSFMLVVYPSSNATTVTISPRVAKNGHSEPTYEPDIHCEKVWSSDLPNANNITLTNNGSTGYMVADAVCRFSGSSNWGLSFGEGNVIKESPFIFAVGPGEALQSDSLSAPLRRHSFYGHFSMDIIGNNFTSLDAVPSPNGPAGTYVSANSQPATLTKTDSNLVPAVHAFLMCLTFVVIFPLGSLLIRLLKKILVHAVCQILGLIFVCAGFGTGINISAQYNRSRDMRSAHQVIGMLVFAALLTQFGLGLLHHYQFKKTQKATRYGKIHTYLGLLVILLGVVNGALGFDLAQNTQYILLYVAIVIGAGVIFVAVRTTLVCCCGGRDRKGHQEETGAEGYQYPEFGAGLPPPAYGQQHAPPTYQPWGSAGGQTHGQQIPLADFGGQRQWQAPVGVQHVYPKYNV